MTTRRRMAIKGAPPSTFEASGIPKTPSHPSHPILCSLCNRSGGTLVKLSENNYRHVACPKEK